MPRVALLCSEPIRPHMAGIGIRYLELFQHLAEAGLETLLITTGNPDDAPVEPAMRHRVRRVRRRRLRATLADADVVIAQGSLASDVLDARPDRPTVVDLYDPWPLEDLHYAGSLGSGPIHDDLATWRHQLSGGDFFLCSTPQQRDFYLGFLTAMGRLHPSRAASDPTLEGLIACVPFGVPETLPPHRPVLPAAPADRPWRLLFGGVYDWLDPAILLEALSRLSRSDYQLVLVASPHPSTTPQERLRETVSAWRGSGLDDAALAVIDWVEVDRRFDLLRDCEILVTTHPAGLEGRLALRTRVLEGMAAGVPCIVTRDGATAALVERYGAGWTVPSGDPAALAGALAVALDDRAERSVRGRAARRVADEYAWSRVIEPLVTFCRHAAVDPTKGALEPRRRRPWGDRLATRARHARQRLRRPRPAR